MNSQKIKELKKIINYDQEDPSQKRLLQRLKKKDKTLSKGDKRILLDKLNKMYNN